MIESQEPYEVRSLRLCVCFVGLCFILLFLCLARQGYAQESNSPDPSSKPENGACTLTGTVVNSATGEPVRRAAVSVFEPVANPANSATPITILGGNAGYGQPRRVILTDSRGRFEFDGLPEERVFISVSKPGFVDGRGMPGGDPAVTNVQVARDASPIVLKLAPAGVIVGRVTTRDEKPLEGFQVRVTTKQMVDGRAWFGNRSQAETNEDGAFRVAGLSPGTYYVAVEQSQETTLSQPGVPNAREQIYAQVFYPGVSEFGAATPLEVRPGQETEANFSLAPEPLYQVSGAVNSQEEVALALTFARKAGDGSDFTQNAQVQDGRFEVKLPAGSYTVTASTANANRLTPGSPLAISSDNPDLHIPLSLLPSIPVEVRREHAGGATEPSLPQSGGVPAMYLQLVSNASFPASAHSWNPHREIQNVEPGTYSVVITTTGQWWVKSAQCGGVDLLSDDLTVAEGAQPPPIEITLRDDAASISGTVTSPNELEPATVLLIQPRGKRNLIKATPAVQGTFEFQSEPPGDYLLLALDDTDQLEYSNPEILSPYLSKATRISVQSHGTASAAITVVHAGR
jgi:hypothetical protein